MLRLLSFRVSVIIMLFVIFFSLITIESIIQIEKDKLIMQIESARNGKSWDEIDSSINQVWVNWLLKIIVTFDI